VKTWVPALACVLLSPPLARREALYQLNPQLANVVVLPILEFIQPVLVPLAIGTALVCAWSFWKHRDARTELWCEKRPRYALLLGVLAIFIPPLGFAALCLMTAVPVYSQAARYARAVLLAALWAIAIELLFSLGM
jgi:hypothetical protein